MGPQELREKLRGAVVILITPFKDNLDLDEAGLRRNIRFLLDMGIRGGLVAGGSLGECYAMSTEERKRLFEIVVEEVSGRAPVICTANHSATLLAVDLARHAEKVGADGVMVLPPYYMTPNDRSILLHFRAVSEAVGIGVVIYNNKWISRVDLSLEQLARLAEFKNVIAVKDCTPDFYRFRQAIDCLGERLTILNCGAEFWEPYAFAVGSRGFLSAMANWAPEISLEVAEAGAAGDLERGQVLYRDRLHPYLEVETSVAAELGDAETIALYKAAMALRGLAGGPVRPPLHPLPEEFVSRLRIAMQKIGVL